MKKIDKNQLDLFGPQVWYEYQLVISPDKEVTDAVTFRKERVGSLIGSDLVNLNSTAQISLLDFLHTEHEMIIKRLEDILSKQKSFHVKLNGAAFFEPSPESKTFYIRVAEKLAIQKLTDQLKNGIGRGKKSNPYLTIVGGISSKNHQIINSELAEFKFEGEFICNGITVLRRFKDVPNGEWDYRVELPFGSLITEKGTI